MDSLLQGVGVFIGILAGVAITILVQSFRDWRSEKQKVKNLRFEIDLNISKIDGWLQEVAKWRNAVNGNALANYFGYFDISKVLISTANDMLATGLLYKHLDYADIANLQLMGGELSFGGEQFVNNVIQQDKANFVQPAAVQNVNFWEQKFETHKANLQAITRKLN